jgi:phage FluMu protein Com
MKPISLKLDPSPIFGLLEDVVTIMPEWIEIECPQCHGKKCKNCNFLGVVAESTTQFEKSDLPILKRRICKLLPPSEEL